VLATIFLVVVGFSTFGCGGGGGFMVADEVSDGGVGLDVDSGDLVRGASVAGGRFCLFLIRDGRGGGGIAAAAAAAAVGFILIALDRFRFSFWW
jgi:hypothetical protein